MGSQSERFSTFDVKGDKEYGIMGYLYENKERTGATMKHNDWNMKPGEFHLTVLGVLMRRMGNI